MQIKCVGASFIKTKKDGTPMMILQTLVPMREAADGTRKGCECKQFFVNLNESEYIFGCSATQLSLDLFVDHELEVSFNMRGSLDSVSVVK